MTGSESNDVPSGVPSGVPYGVPDGVPDVLPAAASPSGRRTVFISYSHADQRQAARLVTALQQHGIDVWWDALIEGGAVFAKSIAVALERCDAVLVLWSVRSVESDWVRDEAMKGRDLRKLVPLSLDGVEPPLGFMQYHAINVSRWRGAADAPELLATVRAISSLSTAPLHAAEATSLQRARGRPISRRAALLSVGGALLLGGAGVLAFRQGLFSELRANSIAVLPFANLSGDPGQGYFASGIAEEVRSTLAASERFQVMAEASSNRFRAQDEDVLAVAREFGVAFILDGSVRRGGALVRIRIELIDGASGFSRWSKTFERAVSDVFAVQTEIANAVARAVAATLGGADARPTVRGTPSPDLQAEPGGTRSAVAFDAYLRGRALYDRGADEVSQHLALAQFDAAIASDPHFAGAHAARSRSLTAIAFQYTKPGERARLVASAVSAAETAILLAPGLADGRSVLGFALFNGRLDARAARRAFDASVQRGAGDASVLGRFALFAARTGRHREAAVSVARAVTLDPLNPLIHAAAGAVAYGARQYVAAIEPAQAALRLTPGLAYAEAAIGFALLQLGRIEEAGAAFAREQSERAALTGAAIVAHQRGEPSAARARLAQLRARFGEEVLYQQAQVRAQLNQPGDALMLLERARVLTDPGLVDLRNDPLLDPLRGNPRFARLLRSVGIE